MNKKYIIILMFSIMLVGLVAAGILETFITPKISPSDEEVISEYNSVIGSDAQDRIDKAIAEEVKNMQKDIEDAEYYNSEEFARQELKIELINLCDKLVQENKGELAKTQLNNLLNNK